LKFIETNCFKNTNKDKELFIKHYHAFLLDYYKQYQQISKDSRSLFIKPNADENKFWLRLIYSALHLKLIKYFKEKNIEVHFDLNSGSTQVPLLNIIPKNWKINGKELLIQFQGDDLKFYAHSNDKTFIESIVNKAKQEFKNDQVDFKKMTKREANSYFIFKTKLSAKIKANQEFNLTNIMNSVVEYYDEIDRKVITKYS
jgi:hypothetical protein